MLNKRYLLKIINLYCRFTYLVDYICWNIQIKLQGKRTLRKLIFSWNKNKTKQVNLPMTKAHVEKRKSFPFGHLWRSFLTDNSADWEPRWLPEPLELLTSPAPRKSENWYFVDIFFFFSCEEMAWYFVTKIVLTYVRKKCSSVWEKLLKFKAEGREFAKFLRSLKNFFEQ